MDKETLIVFESGTNLGIQDSLFHYANENILQFLFIEDFQIVQRRRLCFVLTVILSIAML